LNWIAVDTRVDVPQGQHDAIRGENETRSEGSDGVDTVIP
jgi:hypothetical protein